MKYNLPACLILLISSLADAGSLTISGHAPAGYGVYLSSMFLSTNQSHKKLCYEADGQIPNSTGQDVKAVVGDDGHFSLTVSLKKICRSIYLISVKLNFSKRIWV